MQLILALIEAERANPGLILEDPVDAVKRWSHDPTLQTRVPLVCGQELTAVELQLRFLEEVAPLVASGACDGIVPNAQEIFDLWADTLEKLKTGNLGALAPRLDWVLKLSILQRALAQHRDLTWASPEIKHLDFLYGDLVDGLYWNCEQTGCVERVGVTEERIEHFTREPPANTRAWTRAQLLRLADPATVESVDWDSISFRVGDSGGWPRSRTVQLADPLGFTKAGTEMVFQRSNSLNEVLDLLGAVERVHVSSGSGFLVRDQNYYTGPNSPFYFPPEQTPNRGESGGST